MKVKELTDYIGLFTNVCISYKDKFTYDAMNLLPNEAKERYGEEEIYTINGGDNWTIHIQLER